MRPHGAITVAPRQPMNSTPNRTCCLVSLCLLAGTVSAHGGQYRGTPPLPSPGGRGPLMPSSGLPGPLTPRSAAATPDPTRWQVWWELNKDPYLRRRPGAADGLNSLAAGTPVSEADKRDVILPALRRALETTTNRDITSACLVAIGKIGIDHADFEILPLLRKRLRRGNQEVRETAALAMGISGRSDAIEDLIALLHDRPVGRRLLDRDHVGDRTRAFAAYGLGLIAGAHENADVKLLIFDALVTVLESKSEDDRDVLVACLTGLRLLDPQPGLGPKNKRLLWRCLEALKRYRNQPAGRSQQLVQAHTAPALAHLLGRDGGSDGARFKNMFAATMRAGRRVDSTLYQSATIALGLVARRGEIVATDAQYSELLWKACRTSTDKQVRNLSAIAMGQIGGVKNGERLMALLRAEKGPLRGWAALALGLLAHHEPTTTQKEVADKVGPALLKQMAGTSNRDVRSAIAVALGLARYKPSAQQLRKLLKKYRQDENFGGYLCIGLALMDDEEAVDLIEDVLKDSSLQPLLMTHAALALARLQKRGAQATLQGMLRDDRQLTLTWASAATALGHVGDSESVPALLRLLGDESTPKLLRAFAAASLGLIADDDDLPWNSEIAMNINYRALVETMSNGSSGVLDIL